MLQQISLQNLYMRPDCQNEVSSSSQPFVYGCHTTYDSNGCVTRNCIGEDVSTTITDTKDWSTSDGGNVWDTTTSNLTNVEIQDG
jgi:hypothetical protein